MIRKPVARKKIVEDTSEESRPRNLNNKVVEELEGKVQEQQLELIELRLQIQEYQTQITLLNEQMHNDKFKEKAQAITMLEEELNKLLKENNEYKRNYIILNAQKDTSEDIASDSKRIKEDAVAQMNILEDQLHNEQIKVDMLK